MRNAKCSPWLSVSLKREITRSYCEFACKSAKNSSVNQRKVLVIYTGGTMGMKKNLENALQPFSGYLTKQVLKMEELKSPTMPEVEVRE